MFRRTFKVIFRPMKNNFVLLPDNYYNLVSTYENGCLSLTYGNHCHYTTWVPYGGNIKETEIGMNAKVAKQIGLKEDDLVKCALIGGDVINLKSVYVTPATPKDWEIIELSSDHIQSTLLDQAKIINAAQVLVIWINRSMQVTVTVDRLKPNTSFGRVDNDTDLVIAPNLQQNGTTNGYTPPSSRSISRSQTISDCRNFSPSLSRSTSVNVKAPSDKGSVTKVNRQDKFDRLIKDLRKENTRTFEFRVISGKWEGGQISDVFVTRHNLPDFLDLEQIYLLKTSGDKEYYINVKVIADSDNTPSNIHPTIEINENLMKLLNIKELQKVSLCPRHTILNFVEKIELFAHRKTNYKILEQAFKKYVIENTKLFPLLINQEQVLRLDDEHIVTVVITPEHFKYCLIDAQILKECKLYAADEVRNVDNLFDIEPQEDNIVSVSDLINIKKFDDIVDNLVEQIKANLCLDQTNSILRTGNVLIAGHANSGKTVITERILEKLGDKPYCCFYEIFYCTRSKGRKAESIQKDIRQIFSTSLNNAPSIVVLENLDVLTRSTGDQQTQDGEYFNRVADTVQHLITEYTTSNPIVVIATVGNIQNLNRRLYSPRGRHLFHTIAKIPDLDRDDRELILTDLCSHINSNKLDLVKFSNLTEGYNIGDLVQLVERSIFYAYRLNASAPVLTNELLAKSLENTNSYCLQGVESHNQNEDLDEDALPVEQIPGLESVVEVLEEVLRWPLKYPTIFDESPLRNQAGVLLFGPPGTGKTFLVSQISRSWNLRIISVKGPELLAKYIGQSEENVRNLFSRARSAKPCVLFFDEFDSLAPKRGHDSTGVTDRVVNQLLTELDGVEGLQGVTVIAATSRPELLDPALLRAGRIDRLVECSLPDKKARLGIFKNLAKTLNLDKSVNFEHFAEKTEYYTGADIQSILTSANMIAVKEVLSKFSHDNLPDKIFVTQKHLLEAFNNTRPSLSAIDIARYQRTYSRFTNREKAPKEPVAQRTTLA